MAASSINSRSSTPPMPPFLFDIRTVIEASEESLDSIFTEKALPEGFTASLTSLLSIESAESYETIKKLFSFALKTRGSLRTKLFCAIAESIARHPSRRTISIGIPSLENIPPSEEKAKIVALFDENERIATLLSEKRIEEQLLLIQTCDKLGLKHLSSNDSYSVLSLKALKRFNFFVWKEAFKNINDFRVARKTAARSLAIIGELEILPTAQRSAIILTCLKAARIELLRIAS